MGKYEPLGRILARSARARGAADLQRRSRKSRVRSCRRSASTIRAWWSNNAANNVMTKVWLDAGFESAQVDMEARKLVFRRVAKAGEASGGLAKPSATSDGRHPMRRRVEGTSPSCLRASTSPSPPIPSGLICWTRNTDRKCGDPSMSPLLLDTNAAIWLSRRRTERMTASEKLDEAARAERCDLSLANYGVGGRTSRLAQPLEPRHNTAALVRPYPRNAERASGRICRPTS